MEQKNYPVAIERAVRWGEMDALGHVNNVIYFRYFEDARIVLFNALGFAAVTASEKTGPILAQIECAFRRPLVYPDELTIGTWVSKIGNTSLRVQYDVYSHQQEQVVAEGSSVVVMMNYEKGEKMPVTPTLKAAIKQLHNTSDFDNL